MPTAGRQGCRVNPGEATAIFERLIAKVAEYEGPTERLSVEVSDHYVAEAVAAPSIEVFGQLSVRAAMAIMPSGERSADVVAAVAAAWMMGAAAGAGAARGQRSLVRGG